MRRPLRIHVWPTLYYRTDLGVFVHALGGTTAMHALVQGEW